MTSAEDVYDDRDTITPPAIAEDTLDPDDLEATVRVEMLWIRVNGTVPPEVRA